MLTDHGDESGGRTSRSRSSERLRRRQKTLRQKTKDLRRGLSSFCSSLEKSDLTQVFCLESCSLLSSSSAYPADQAHNIIGRGHNLCGTIFAKFGLAAEAPFDTDGEHAGIHRELHVDP